MSSALLTALEARDAYEEAKRGGCASPLRPFVVAHAQHTRCLAAVRAVPTAELAAALWVAATADDRAPWSALPAVLRGPYEAGAEAVRAVLVAALDGVK